MLFPLPSFRRLYLARAGCLFLLLLSSCAVPSTSPQDKMRLSPLSFKDLRGWNDDRVSDALPALAASCRSMTRTSSRPGSGGLAGTAADWAAPCAALVRITSGDDDGARAFFEAWFQPWRVAGADGGDGLFTGYYEAELQGSWTRTARFHVPLYGRPRDLVTADLGAFRSEWKGRRIAGKLERGHLVPYDDRTAIARGALAHRARVLLWVDDPVDAFFLAIQGSGRVHMTDGTVTRVGYAAANGQPYVAIGRALADFGAINRPVTMQSIREWLSQNPDRAADVMNLNPSYVFFKILKTTAPLGAAGVALTPRRSLAVDSAYIPLGLPLWLETETGSCEPLRQLMVAQDTGGAIKGPVRGDVFWGFGPQAEAEAGAMQSRGTYALLLPKTLVPHAGP